ncbi:PDZ domain-containing protein [Enterococcus faecium]
MGLTVNPAMQIVRLVGNSPAQKANLQIGDQIVSVDGQSVAQMNARMKV